MLETPQPSLNAGFFIAREACPLCGSRDVETLYSSPYLADPVRSHVAAHYRTQGHVEWRCLEGTDFVVCDCRDCGLLFQKHAPNDLLLEQVYSVMSNPASFREHEMRRLTIEEFQTVAGELAVLFEMTGKSPREIRFLDHGMGYARWARVAVAMGAEVYATEITEDKIAFARSLGVRVITQAEMRAMSFDIVHTEQVFEHLVSPREEFDQLVRVLAPGGILKIAVPTSRRIRRLLRTRGMAPDSPLAQAWSPDPRAAPVAWDYICVTPLEHLNMFGLRPIRYLCEQSGLRLVGRSRREFVSIDPLMPRRVVHGAGRLIRVMVRPLFRDASGYYLLTR